MDDQAFRSQLIEFLEGKGAHADLEAAVSKLPLSQAGLTPSETPHSIWQLLEHIRITLDDLVRFSTSKDYAAIAWPKDYWPKAAGPASAAEWSVSLQAIKDHLQTFFKLIRDPETDLMRPIPWGEGQTLLREILLAGDHTSYHVGQIILIRRQLGNWKAE